MLRPIYSILYCVPVDQKEKELILFPFSLGNLRYFLHLLALSWQHREDACRNALFTSSIYCIAYSFKVTMMGPQSTFAIKQATINTPDFSPILMICLFLLQT